MRERRVGERGGSFNKAPGDKRKMTMLRHLFKTVSLMVCVFFKILFQNNRFEINLYVLGNLIRLRQKKQQFKLNCCEANGRKGNTMQLDFDQLIPASSTIESAGGRDAIFHCFIQLFVLILTYSTTQNEHTHIIIFKRMSTTEVLRNFYQSNPFHLQWKFI